MNFKLYTSVILGFLLAVTPIAAVNSQPVNSNVPIPVNVEGQKASFRFAGSAVTSFAASPTDWITITGSATKTVKITNISICGFATAASTIDMLILRRSTADTAGTSTVTTAAKLDPVNIAATATVNVYTANPTLGTLVANIDTPKFNLGTSAGSAGCLFLDFGVRNTQSLTLRGAASQIAINLAGVTVPSGTNLNYRIEETEE